MNHIIFADSPEQVSYELAWATDASDEMAEVVINSEVETGEGRSTWYWIRLPNGDLILGCFPQGATYELVAEGEAAYVHSH